MSLVIYPIDVFQVCDNVEQQLRADQNLMALNPTIENNGLKNDDPGNCPWIGIYRTGVKYPPRTIGRGTGYRYNKVGLVIVTQQSDLQDPKECARLLEQLNQSIVRVLMNDESLGGIVDVLDELEVVYDSYGQVGDAYMQTSLIHFVGQAAVSASGG